MTDNFVRREVQRRDDPFGIPACFYWTIDEVADWVDSIGYGKYKENFRSHFINGRKLLTVDACALPKMGITHFGDILAVSSHIRAVGGQERRPVEPTAPYLDYLDMDHRDDRSLRYPPGLNLGPSITDPWHGAERRIAKKVAADNLYFTCDYTGPEGPHYIPR